MAMPRLRFKNKEDLPFRDWEKANLSSLFEETNIRGGENLEALTVVQGQGTVKRSESERNLIYDKSNLDKYKQVSTGDFVVHLRSFEGGLELSQNEGLVSPAYHILRGKDIVAEFYYPYFRSPNFINGPLKMCVVGIRDGRSIDMKDLAKAKIPYPCVEEQQKIADFLSIVDEKLEVEQKKLADLEQIKKGFMQKIFNQEIRFKSDDGNEYPEWNNGLLQDVCIGFSSGQTPSRDNPEFYKGTIPWLSSGEMNRGIVYETREHITEDGKKNANLEMIPAGTFLMTITGLEADRVCGNCCMLGIDSTVNQSCMYLYPKTDKLITRYLFQWYLFVGKKYAKRYCQGTKQQSYNAELVKALPIDYPSLPEQQKIADFFTALDERIENQRGIVEDWKLIKKGFLQQMFPSED